MNTIKNNFNFQIVKASDPSSAYKNCVYLNPIYTDIKYLSFDNYQPTIPSDSPKPNYKKYIYKVIPSNEFNQDQICLNMSGRRYCGFTLWSKINIVPNNTTFNSLSKVTILINPTLKFKYDIILDDDILQQIKQSLYSIPLSSSYEYYYKNEKFNDSLSIFIFSENKDNEFFNMMLTENTEIEFTTTSQFIQIQSANKPTIFNGNFNFEEMGIGGLNKQFEIIFRRAFASRIIPDKIIKDLGINHVRGILLHGPPGTGKTLIARQIGKILNCAEPKIVNGPSLLSKYVGQSEENVRNLFVDAINDKSAKQLHLIICDEFDALVKKRGSSNDNTGTGDKIVNQFLSMIDGPESLNNILLICMTNRVDLIDEAMLRPGRLEVQIEISLPDEAGRNEILKIHTKKMNTTGYLDSSVDIGHVASITKNFTGAELESVVKNSVSFALSRDLDPSNLSSVKNIKPVINHDDFIRAVKEIKPQFGSKSSVVDIICSSTFDLYSEDYSDAFNEITTKLIKLKPGSKISFGIIGPNYIGKTKLACHLAKNSDYNCIRFINSETLCNYLNKDMHLNELINNGLRSESVIFIIDSIEKVIEYSKLGNVYNNKILQIIYMLLDKIIEPNIKVCIMVTSSNPTLYYNMELDKMIDYTFELNNDTNISQVFRKFKINN